MANERWRMGGDDRERRFNPPYDADDVVPDFDNDDEFGLEYEERPKMNFGKAWSMLMASVGAVVLVVGSIAFFLMHGLKPLGISLSYREAFVVSGCLFAIRFVDTAVVESLRRRSR